MSESESTTDEAREDAAVQFNEDTVSEMVSTAVRETLEEERQNGEPEERDVAPETEEGRGNARVTRDHRESEAVMAKHVLGLMRTSTTQPNEARKHAEALVKGGHYERSITEEARAAGDFYSTVVNADGAFLLPTQVRDEIEELADQVGVAREICDTFSQIVGSIKVPGATGVEDQADFVAEGGTITSNKRAFESVTLNPRKVAQIVPWTYEAGVELAPQILDDVTRALARSFARAEDDALLNGDGTASYNSIDGLFSANKSVPVYTIGSGAGTAEDPGGIDPDDLILALNSMDPGARNNRDRMYYVFHPDMRQIFLTRKDNNGQYIFDYVEEEEVQMIKGIQVLYTEVLPEPGSSQPATSFGAAINGSFFDMATGEGMTTEELRTGTVQDADTGSDINLATQDLRALKARRFFDLDFNFDSAAVQFETSAT
jgi:HK97 family phage major capsid protein